MKTSECQDDEPLPAQADQPTTLDRFFPDITPTLTHNDLLFASVIKKEGEEEESRLLYN